MRLVSACFWHVSFSSSDAHRSCAQLASSKKAAPGCDRLESPIVSSLTGCYLCVLRRTLVLDLDPEVAPNHMLRAAVLKSTTVMSSPWLMSIPLLSIGFMPNASGAWYHRAPPAFGIKPWPVINAVHLESGMIRDTASSFSIALNHSTTL